jgi:hypothetical protein
VKNDGKKGKTQKLGKIEEFAVSGLVKPRKYGTGARF